MKKQPLEAEYHLHHALEGVFHKNNLGDFDVFLAAVKKVLESPEQFGLEVE